MRINSTRELERQGNHSVLTWTGMRCALTALLVTGLAGVSVHAQDNVLEKFVGRWDVRVKQPQKPDLTYIETYEWMLDRKFVRGRTEGKPDGTEDMVVIGYEPKVNGYPFWIFSSSGTYLYLTLAPGTWDARSRTMEWKSPPLLLESYQARCILDDNTRRCTLVVKNWVGKVLHEQESVAVRRND